MTFHTQRLKATAPRITKTLMMTPTGFRHSFGVRAGSADAGCGFIWLSCAGPASVLKGSCGRAVTAELLSGLSISISETHQPSGHCEEDCHAQINQSWKTQMAVEFQANQDLARNHGQRQPENDADHPRGKIGAQNVDRWGMSIHCLRYDAVDPAGLPRSPTLNARAAALV